LWLSGTAFGRDSLPEVKSKTASSSHLIFGIKNSVLARRAFIFFQGEISFNKSSKNTYFSFNFSVQVFFIFS
jgi:hypothetical protein